MLTFIAPGLVGGLWIFRLPESPKYLLTQNRDEKALEVVRWIYKTNKGDAREFDIDALQPEPIEGRDCEKKTKLYEILRIVFATFIICVFRFQTKCFQLY
jgi:hypothetical protein